MTAPACVAAPGAGSAPGHYLPGASTNHFMGRCLECDVHYLAGATWEDAHRWYREGRIGQDEWEAFAHVWATSACRHSPLGDGHRQEPQSPAVRRLAALIGAVP